MTSQLLGFTLIAMYKYIMSKRAMIIHNHNHNIYRLTVRGNEGDPPYHADKARQTGSGSNSKSRPRASILSRLSRPPSLVRVETCNAI